jgi:hypothetical protein
MRASPFSGPRRTVFFASHGRGGQSTLSDSVNGHPFKKRPLHRARFCFFGVQPRGAKAPQATNWRPAPTPCRRPRVSHTAVYFMVPPIQIPVFYGPIFSTNATNVQASQRLYGFIAYLKRVTSAKSLRVCGAEAAESRVVEGVAHCAGAATCVWRRCKVG